MTRSSDVEPVILVVDDSSTNRYLLRTILTGSGYRVKECEDGRQCIDECKRACPGMVLLDVMMPEMDGIEACKRLRELFTRDELPIIMVTTRSEGPDIAEGLQAGANDYVTKPIDRTILLARMENQFAISRATHQIRGQQRDLERALRIQAAMGDVLPDGLALQDGNGALLYENRVSKDLSGNRPSRTIGELFEHIFHGAIRDEAVSLLEEVAADPGLSLEEEIQAKDGGSYQIITKPIQSEDGGGLRLWLWRDVTRTRALERKLKERAKLDTARLFAAGVAHNFNNIMSVILGATELLRRWAEGNEKADKCLSSITQSIDIGSKFVKKLYTVAEETGGGGSRTDVKPVLDRVALELGNEASKLRVTLSVDAPAGLPPVGIDFESLQEIVDNIVRNALDSIKDSGEVGIAAKAEGDEVHIIVRDNGRGMDSSTLQRIFEPFFSTKKIDHAHGVSLEGHGLGLWNVYYLLRMVGGDVDVTSARDEGTEVRLRLPRAKRE